MGGRGGAGGVGGALPALSGSEKQVKWANDIRNDFIRNISEVEKLIKWSDKTAPEDFARIAEVGRNSKEGRELVNKQASISVAIDGYIRGLIRMPNRTKGGFLTDRGESVFVRYGYDFMQNEGWKKPGQINYMKEQRRVIKQIISDAKAFAKSETSASIWIDSRRLTEKRKLHISGKNITYSD